MPNRPGRARRVILLLEEADDIGLEEHILHDHLRVALELLVKLSGVETSTLLPIDGFLYTLFWHAGSVPYTTVRV